ncbi:PGF-CTERM sorting domain-containing protein [Halobacterium litoreum]|uniref:PGF-CTERM sorting domain-containing protein n=1 Tax=Halobacterium litoreum TaxID=2039234 RepID=A0ABD5NHT8_9EURY|nr:PGF-CTERM sorting domain-containing protein [Halobacterium litoreum]UHH12306.1 PGF-CTERM sorting domain-containing protein [Halobacterium litoreum]
MNDTLRRTLAALVALTVVGAGAFGAATAASNGSLLASPDAAGETSTHTVTVTVGNASAGSWNGLTVDYSASDADASEVGSADVETVGIDRDADANDDAIDVNVSDDLSSVQTSNNGETLTVKFGGSYELNAGDEVVVTYSGVQNPEEAGEYTVPLDLNPQSSGGDAQAVYSVTSADGDGGTQTTSDGGDSDTTTDSDESDSTTESAGGDGDDGSGESGGSVPGFGVAVALIALVGAALLAVRE